MSSIQQLFASKQQRVLNVYCTAGYPQLDSTLTVMKALQNKSKNSIVIAVPQTASRERSGPEESTRTT